MGIEPLGPWKQVETPLPWGNLGDLRQFETVPAPDPSWSKGGNGLPARFAGLRTLLKARDPFTRDHSDEVGRLIGAMMEEAGADPLQIRWGVLAGRLHDIGKLAMLPSLLMKRGRLSPTEQRRLRLHPVIGARLLESMVGRTELSVVALHHHERFDGKGYPAGLGGEEIPLSARLAAVADTFHALTANRPYRRGLSHQRGLKLLKQLKGSQLCPESVDLFQQAMYRRPEFRGLQFEFDFGPTA